MKLFFSFVIVIVSLPAFSQYKSCKSIIVDNEFNNLFEQINTDTLQVSNFLYSEGKEFKTWTAKLIPKKYFDNFNNLNFDNLIALARVNFDKEDNLVAYLVSNIQQDVVFLYVFSKNKYEFVFSLKVASNTLMNETYKEISNVWILDYNKDGKKDIAIWQSLKDFKFSAEGTDNISNDSKYLYLNVNDKFKYKKWDRSVLQNVELK